MASNMIRNGISTFHYFVLLVHFSLTTLSRQKSCIAHPRYCSRPKQPNEAQCICMCMHVTTGCNRLPTSEGTFQH